VIYNFKDIFSSQQGIIFLRKHNLFLSLFITFLIGAYYFLSEKINYGGGFGWDGIAYGKAAQDFYS